MIDTLISRLLTMVLLTLMTVPRLFAQEVSPAESVTAAKADEQTSTTSVALPDEIQSQIATLEAELAVQKADLGERHPTIKKLNDKITALREAGAELLGQVTVLHLKNARAKDVAEKIEQLFPDKTRNLVVDERTNSLMLRGDEKLIRDVEQIVQILDAAVPPGGENTNADPNSVPSMKTPGEKLPVPATRSPFGGEHFERMSTVEGSLASNPPVAIAEYRRRLTELETPVLQLAEKVRFTERTLGKDHPDSVQQRAELRALVQKNFGERQEIQRAELAEFTRRLQRMQQAIEFREKVAEKIVDQRVEELLREGNSKESNSNLLDRTALPLPGSHDDVNTSALTAAAGLITKTYPVGNYVTATFFDQAIALQNPSPSLDAAADSIRQKAEELITQISSHNKPAAISFDSARLQLVVSHTAEGHRALGELFATIKLPMQEKLTFSRCEVNEQIYSAFKDSPVWTAFDEFRNEVEDGGWIGVRKNEFVKWFERVLKESPAGDDFGQPTALVLAAGVPYQFDAGEIRVALTARIDPASQKPQLRIDYAELSGRPSGTRMISDLEDLAVWIPSSEESTTFLVYESVQGRSFQRHDSLQKQDTAPPQPIAIAPDVTEEVPGSEIVSLTLFEVSDSTFMPSEDSAPGQSLAPDNFDEQLESMLKNKTAKLLGKHAIETTGNQLATLHSGGKFEVPSSSSERKEERMYGTTIEITPRTLNGERVFQILWSERVRNFENAVSGIPGIDEKRIQLDVTSPLPGSPGYLIGPAKGKNQPRRLFIHFLLEASPNVAARTQPPVEAIQIRLRCNHRMSLDSGDVVFADDGRVAIVSRMVGMPMGFNFVEGDHQGPYQLTFERNNSSEDARTWLRNNVLPVEFLAEDQERATSGQLVAKVIYLRSGSTIAETLHASQIETISSHNIEAGVNPVSVAAEKGTVIGIVRISQGAIRSVASDDDILPAKNSP